jgi:putative intracellular protease/amidase
MKKVLFVLTSHPELGDTGRKTGWYLPEVTHPLKEILEAGLNVDFVSPEGGAAPIDPGSLKDDDPISQEFLNDPKWKARFDNTLDPSRVVADDYDAIFFAGGHGTMWDLPDNEALANLAASIYEKGGLVAAVCHGPAGLLNVELSDGSHLVDGRNLTSFTNEEEKAVHLEEVVPFLLESKLVERGARHQKAEKFHPKVVVDGRLVTGQNPASARAVGQALAELLTVAPVTA